MAPTEATAAANLNGPYRPRTFGAFCWRIGLSMDDSHAYSDMLQRRRDAEARRRGRGHRWVNPSGWEALAWVRAGRPARKMTRAEADAVRAEGLSADPGCED